MRGTYIAHHTTNNVGQPTQALQAFSSRLAYLKNMTGGQVMNNCLQKLLRQGACGGTGDSHVRYVLKIHFFIEFGLKMIQFKIQFKTKSKIFIQKNIHSKQNPKYSFKKIFIQ